MFFHGSQGLYLPSTHPKKKLPKMIFLSWLEILASFWEQIIITITKILGIEWILLFSNSLWSYEQQALFPPFTKVQTKWGSERFFQGLMVVPGRCWGGNLGFLIVSPFPSFSWAILCLTASWQLLTLTFHFGGEDLSWEWEGPMLPGRWKLRMGFRTRVQSVPWCLSCIPRAHHGTWHQRVLNKRCWCELTSGAASLVLQRS